MAIVTISRQAGSLGDEIAEKVADQLGYLFVEKEKLYELASDFHGDYTKEMDVLSRESKPGFFDSLFSHRTVYHHLMASMVFEFAGKNNVVIKGRGGQFLLRETPFVLNVLIKAPFEIRVKRIAESLGMEVDAAAAIVKKSDHAREEFNRYLYNEHVDESSWYDAIFDTATIPDKNIVDFIVNEAVRIENETPMKKSEGEKYEGLALEKRIETVLIKEMADSNYLKVRSRGGGDVLIAGYLSTEREYETAEAVVRGVKGVNSVENNIIVSQYPVKLWH